jgi:hypothetical protein
MRYKGRKTGLRRAASMTFNNCIAGTGRQEQAGSKQKEFTPDGSYNKTSMK